MDNEHTKKSLVLELARTFTTIFTMSALAVSLAGLLAVHFTPDEQFVSEVFPAIITGSFYSTVLQIAGFSFILAVFVLLLSQRFIPNMRFWLRMLLVFLSAFCTFAVFALIFKWFPVNNLHVWLGFILCTIICSAFSLGITLLRFKLEGKKYDKLLAHYKERRNLVSHF
jgi:hypothetical protein